LGGWWRRRGDPTGEATAGSDGGRVQRLETRRRGEGREEQASTRRRLRRPGARWQGGWRPTARATAVARGGQRTRVRRPGGWQRRRAGGGGREEETAAREEVSAGAKRRRRRCGRRRRPARGGDGRKEAGTRGQRRLRREMRARLAVAGGERRTKGGVDGYFAFLIVVEKRRDYTE